MGALSAPPAGVRPQRRAGTSAGRDRQAEPPASPPSQLRLDLSPSLSSARYRRSRGGSPSGRRLGEPRSPIHLHLPPSPNRRPEGDPPPRGPGGKRSADGPGSRLPFSPNAG